MKNKKSGGTTQEWSIINLNPMTPLIIIDEGGYTIAELFTMGNKRNQKKQLKNAYLMAASPQMLVALKEEEKTRKRDISFIKELKKYLTKHDTKEVESMLGYWERELLKRNQTINAIKKATP